MQKMNPSPREAELLILQLKTKHGEHCEVATGGSLIPSQEIYSGSGSLKKPIQNYAVDAVKRLRCITGTTLFFRLPMCCWCCGVSE